jgi:molybdenum cofactor biosynthesis enzyme
VKRLTYSSITLALGTMILMALPLSAAASTTSTTRSNTVTINIKGGSATAVAACLNAIKTGSYSDADQRNSCKNSAYAAGGKVYLRHVSIDAVQDNSSGTGTVSNASNTVNVTIAGGNATALAACVNLAATGNSADVDQSNRCRNTAVASGGAVILNDVTISTLQIN